MLTETTSTSIIIPDETLDNLQNLYDRGLYLQAYQQGERHGPLHKWSNTPARILAGRMAINLGAPRLCFRLHSQAWHDAPHDPRVCYFYGLALMDTRGPLSTWKFFRTRPFFSQISDETQADWLALQARLASRLRDFSTAENYLHQAQELAPEQPWIWLERSACYQYQDRNEEALQAAEKALELRSWYRPAVQVKVHLLQLLGRDQEALEILQEAIRQLESGMVAMQLALLQTELGHYAEARKSYDRYAELSPLMEKVMGLWLTARRCEAAYLDGDFAAAVEFARELKDDPAHNKLAERLSETPVKGKRHVLPVEFVRQHHRTCVPATLTSISRFWSMPADHLEIATEICYDGTPAHSERRWAEEHGWAVREFTVTWDSTVSLLDRGIPYTLTFVEPTFSHLQACMGYDSIQDVLLIRDPTHRYFVQYPADDFLKRYQATGPRGMALVPQERAELLEGVTLPDTELYDQVYEFNQALEKHQRERAAQICEDMKASAPDHYLTWQARLTLSRYDANNTEMLANVEGLLKLFPEDGPLQLQKINCLRDLVRHDERLQLLKRQSENKEADLVFRLLYAQELARDARQDRQTERLLRQMIRIQPSNAQAFSTLAHVWWGQRRFEEALQLYRWAACLEDKNEFLVQTWFNASRHLNQTEEVLNFLQDRFERFGRQSAQPAFTLYWAYTQLEKRTEAFEVLQKAMELRPDDGDLMLYAARARANHGEMEEATELLDSAKGRSVRTIWLRTAAHLALLQGRHTDSLEMWQEVVKVEPLAMDAHREIAILLAETGLREESLNHLQRTCERFPYHYGLHQLWIEWLRQEGAEASEPAVRKLVEIRPDDAWAHRELALLLADKRRLDEAIPEAEMAIRLDPTNPTSYTTRGRLHFVAGQIEEAKKDYTQALRLSINFDFALNELVGCCQSLAERQEVFALVQEELERQVILGDVLLTYRDQARETLQPEEVLALLRKAHAARPDLWQSWSVLTNQLIDMGELAEAVELAREATSRFPLLPVLWLNQGRVCQFLNDSEGEIAAIRRALEINSTWGEASRHLASAYKRAGNMEEAKATIERAIQLTPLDSINHGFLAHLLWSMGEKEEAIQALRQAVYLAPGYQWAWDMLAAWSHQMDKPEVALETARELTEKRPQEARSWLMLSRMLLQPDAEEERLAALDKAIELNPRCVDAFDQKAELLTQQSRYDEALETCRAPVWEGKLPLTLRGRATWIEACRGNMQEAISQMREILQEDPSYYWGWTQLAKWLRDFGTAEEYQEAISMIVKLNPQDWVSFGFLGESKARMGDREGAKQAYLHALEINPEYQFAVFSLFDIYFYEKEWDKAEEVLAGLKKYTTNAYVMFREVELASRRQEKEEAVEVLRELVARDDSSGYPLEAATTAMLGAGWAEDADDVFREALENPLISPQVGDLWMRCCMAHNGNCEEYLEELLTGGEVGAEALARYVQTLGERRQSQLLDECLLRYKHSLRSNMRCWGLVGFALANMDRYSETVIWLGDYTEREGLEAWMLLNLVIALRAAAKDEEANHVSRLALELKEDATTPYHRIWLAVDEALNESSATDGYLVAIEQANLDVTHRFLKVLVQALRKVQKAEPAERGKLFPEVRQMLSQTASECTPLITDRPAVERTYVRCVQRLAKDCGGVLPGLWAFWRTMFPLLPKKGVG